jgi:hypothetical protein
MFNYHTFLLHVHGLNLAPVEDLDGHLVARQHMLSYLDLHSTAQHSTAQHSTAQHSTAQHSTAQHGTARHGTPQHITVA